MARAINKLSAGFVSKVKDRGTYSDGGGLILRVAPGGSKQWQFRYRFHNRERYLGPGGLQTVCLSQPGGTDAMIRYRAAAKRAAAAPRYAISPGAPAPANVRTSSPTPDSPWTADRARQSSAVPAMANATT